MFMVFVGEFKIFVQTKVNVQLTLKNGSTSKMVLKQASWAKFYVVNVLFMILSLLVYSKETQDFHVPYININTNNYRLYPTKGIQERYIGKSAIVLNHFEKVKFNPSF